MAIVSNPAFELFKGALERFDDSLDVQPSKRQKRALADSNEASFVDMNLINDDENEDEGEIMLLAMILLQIHGVKLSAASAQELDHNKKKRQRTSPDQLAILEQIFQTDKMPSQQTRLHLAEQLGMSSRRVQIWFQNKRAKVKRGLNKSNEDDISSPENDEVPSVSSPSDQQAPSSPTVSSFASSNAALSSITLSTLHLLNASSSLVPTSPHKKSQIVPLKESAGNYADMFLKK